MSLPRYFLLLLFVFVVVVALSSGSGSDTRRSSIGLRDINLTELSLAGKASVSDQKNSPKALAFAKEAAAKIADQANVRGADPSWFFLVRELKQIAAGRFWEEPWEDVAENKTDPLPSALEFQKLLKAKGIKLIVVPIPAKASIYPDKFSAKYSPGDVQSLSPLIKRFSDAGLNVVDLEPMFLARRNIAPDDLLYCAQDAHFSALACELVSDYVFQQVNEIVKPKENSDLGLSPIEVIKIVGDQVRYSEWEKEVEPETLNVRYAGKKVKGKIAALKRDPASSVLLLGDSHTLVFHEGEKAGMHCRGAGLFDHLSAKFGMPIDLVGVRGSGLVQARKQLYYRAASIDDYWATKKVVVWVFSTREFTQSYDKMVSIPIEK